MPVVKEFKTFEEQIDILKQRGLKFANQNKAIDMLGKYNYFDVVNGFESILKVPMSSQKVYDDVYFEDFSDLYYFDMELKKHTLRKIFDIESRLRTSISYHFAKYHCDTTAKTLNYLNPSYYVAPPTTDTHLTNVFNKFTLFRVQRTHRGRITSQSFLDKLKDEKNYVAQYQDPPFWVVIKSLPLGTLYYLLLFLDSNVKKDVLNDFGLTIADEKAFEQAIYILKVVRNECAHLELISRCRIKRTQKMNFFNEVSGFANLSNSDLNYMDAVKVIDKFTSIKDIKSLIGIFYLKMFMKRRKKIADKIISKMGRKDIREWLRL